VWSAPQPLSRAGGEGGHAEALEGTQTNFAAFDADGTLCTAGAGVLEGTVRRVVLELAAEAGVRVSLTAPRLSDVTRWTGAALTSTSRLLLPVDEVVYGVDLGGRPVPIGSPGCVSTATHKLPPRTPAQRELEARVAAAVERHSEDVVAV
jgi:branched-subunit amino acid aminotransferase/4-amino-4-deoxychorismate lyase